MQLGILGTGNVAQILAKHWSAAGHDITLGPRKPAEAGAPAAWVVKTLNAAAMFAAILQSLRSAAFNIRLVTP
jgi:8-hydroxy-5-deazaflavin:NADPH oxidoreductase